MRVSEKTIELNFCAQFAARYGEPVLWFGLTQKQEARLGFDAWTRMGGRLLVFQFKASNDTLSSGRRRSAGSHSGSAADASPVEG